MRCQCQLQAYEDEKGNEVFISPGIGKTMWGAFRLQQRKSVVALHRVVSPVLPMVECRMEAQRNLDLFARHRKGWTPVRTCRVCGCTERRACQGGCSWVSPDLCSKCSGETTE